MMENEGSKKGDSGEDRKLAGSAVHQISYGRGTYREITSIQ